MILEKTLVVYANDSTLFVEIPNPSSRVSTVLSFDSDLVRIGHWCKHWGMLINPFKTKALVITRSKSACTRFSLFVVGWYCGR